MLFTGDLLFYAGCGERQLLTWIMNLLISSAGKIFEGTGEKMLKSLDLVNTFDDQCLVWPG